MKLADYAYRIRILVLDADVQCIYFKEWDQAEWMFNTLAKQNWITRVSWDRRTGKTWGAFEIEQTGGAI